MQVKQFRYSADNLGYVVHGSATALVIDGGAVGEILAYAQAVGVEIRFVTNTHSHPDHTSGNAALLRKTRAAVLPPAVALAAGLLGIDGEGLAVIATPGHSVDSICFHGEGFLVTGDTLFNGTVGNCFSGDLKAFHRSIRQLMGYPGGTRIYAGHDYVRDSLALARQLEPKNPALERYWKTYDPELVVSTLGQELAVNPFLRFNEEPIIAYLRAQGLPVGSEYERWESLMTAG
jgi:hydroxyacylglutathione hydrolase